MAKRKNTGRQDFSGQDSGPPASTPEAEARTNKDARPKLTKVPEGAGRGVSQISSDGIEQRLGKGRCG